MENLTKKHIGSIAHSFCAAYFAYQGYIVSQPLYDNAKYDLIVDDGSTLRRVQCKYSSHVTTFKGVSYISVSLKTGHIKPQETYGPKDFDLLWVMTPSAFYLIPVAEIFQGKERLSGIKLTPKWNQFIIEFPHPTGDDEVRQKQRATLTDVEKTRITTLYQAGVSSAHIAAQLGLKRSAVSTFLSRTGIHRDTSS